MSAGTFICATIVKTRAVLAEFLADPTKLSAAAKYHDIPPEWARFYIKDELNRVKRKD